MKKNQVLADYLHAANKARKALKRAYNAYSAAKFSLEQIARNLPEDFPIRHMIVTLMDDDVLRCDMWSEKARRSRRRVDEKPQIDSREQMTGEPCLH